MKSERNIDIIKDLHFVQANEMFKGMAVIIRKVGKGFTKSIVPIDDTDLMKFANTML